ncbi:hypothetical protein CEXT_561561 [Caerostris extrusa]|uniref:Uncharacterized protein n=1 Tax=Caerostris extrusa TaxID=172846 RepID=A0AAV4WNC4_CAEEX|nr:hypothetical protein CEXT_561561 [Caerostris extrusa]
MLFLTITDDGLENDIRKNKPLPSLLVSQKKVSTEHDNSRNRAQHYKNDLHYIHLHRLFITHPLNRAQKTEVKISKLRRGVQWHHSGACASTIAALARVSGADFCRRVLVT